MNDYIEKAHRTSAPVEPVMDRLAKWPSSLTSLFYILTGLMIFAARLDKWKAWAYYGKGGSSYPVPPRWDEIEGGMDATALEKALEVIPDLHFLEILHAIVGIGSEAGEMIESLLPALYTGAPLDVVNVHEESGDLLWYLAKLFRFTGTTFDAVQMKNIAKLAKRYPDKFTETAAQVRDTIAERSVMEVDTNVPYWKWLGVLEYVAALRGYKKGINAEAYKPYYDEGLSPEETLDADEENA